MENREISIWKLLTTNLHWTSEVGHNDMVNTHASFYIMEIQQFFRKMYVSLVL